MVSFHKVVTASFLVLALAAVGQAAASSSSASVTVMRTTYLKQGPVGVTVKGDAVNAGGMCSGIARIRSFTSCRAGNSRYATTACAWGITSISTGTSVAMWVSTTRAKLPSIHRTMCPSIDRYLHLVRGLRIVRLK